MPISPSYPDLSLQEVSPIGRNVKRASVAGQIAVFVSGAIPDGWMECAGQTLSVSKYRALFRELKNIHGGDGINTFRIPDLRGCSPLVPDSSGKTTTCMLVGRDGPYEVVDAPPQNPDLVIYARGMVYGAGTSVEFHGGTVTSPLFIGPPYEVDANKADFFVASVNGAVTWTIKNAKPGKIIHLQIANGASGLQTFWPGIKWTNGAQPAFTQYVDGLMFAFNGQYWTGAMSHTGCR